MMIVSFNSNTMSVTRGVGTTYPRLDIYPSVCWVGVGTTYPRLDIYTSVCWVGEGTTYPRLDIYTSACWVRVL